MPCITDLTLVTPGPLADGYTCTTPAPHNFVATVQVNKILISQLITSVTLNGEELTAVPNYPTTDPHYAGTVNGKTYEVVFETIDDALRAVRLIGC